MNQDGDAGVLSIMTKIAADFWVSSLGRLVKAILALSVLLVSQAPAGIAVATLGGPAQSIAADQQALGGRIPDAQSAQSSAARGQALREQNARASSLPVSPDDFDPAGLSVNSAVSPADRLHDRFSWRPRPPNLIAASRFVLCGIPDGGRLAAEAPARPSFLFRATSWSRLAVPCATCGNAPMFRPATAQLSGRAYNEIVAANRGLFCLAGLFGCLRWRWLFLFTVLTERIVTGSRWSQRPADKRHLDPTGTIPTGYLPRSFCSPFPTRRTAKRSITFW